MTFCLDFFAESTERTAWGSNRNLSPYSSHHLIREETRVAFTSNSPRKQFFVHLCYRKLQETNGPCTSLCEVETIYILSILFSDKNEQPLTKQNKKYGIKQDSISKRFLNLRKLLNTSKIPQKIATAKFSSPCAVRGKSWHFSLTSIKALWISLQQIETVLIRTQTQQSQPVFIESLIFPEYLHI